MQLCSSDIVRIELQRAVRSHVPELMPRVRSILDALLLTAVSTEMCVRAARVEPSSLRSLDDLYLVAAMDLGGDLEGIVTYDERLAEAARANGIPVISPR